MITENEVKKLVSLGENSHVQFKEKLNNTAHAAQEMVAFANTKGGKILIGVTDKNSEIIGLSTKDIHRLNDLIVTAANEHIKPPLFVTVDTLEVEGKKVMCVEVPEGLAKPYKDKNGTVFLKNGANKRKVTNNQELARLLQAGQALYAEEMILHHANYDDISDVAFADFYEKTYHEKVGIGEKARLLENLRLGKAGHPNLACALLFTRYPEKNITPFFITAISFWGNALHENEYKSTEDIRGTLVRQYERGFDFIYGQLDKVQHQQSFNSQGIPEIPPIVLKEILMNALVHRDYFIQDSIKIFVFQNRVEIHSPGRLPNSLTEEQVRRGICKKRNAILDSLGRNVLEYRGAGSGILRALAAWPHIDFYNDTDAERFLVTIHRPSAEEKFNSHKKYFSKS